MTLERIGVVGCLAMLMASCGGSGSETPPPVEPTAPRNQLEQDAVQPADTAEPNVDDVENEDEPIDSDGES